MDKLFPTDKNYILKEVQADIKEKLLEVASSKAFENFQLRENPMGLIDGFISDLSGSTDIRYSFFSDGYDLLTHIYRLYYGQIQLEFLWDGRSHYEYYELEWTKKFIEWQDALASEKDYCRLILKGAFLKDSPSNFLSESLERIILKHFQVKRTKKGLALAA